MWIVRLALRRPYTVATLCLLIFLGGGMSLWRIRADVLPAIDIPVVIVVWSYPGLPANDMEKRVTFISERAFSTTVSGISRIESQSISGLSLLRVYFEQGSDIGGAIAQISSVSNTLLRALPPGMTAPVVVRFNASNVPVAQLTLSGENVNEQQLFDYGLNFLRLKLFTVPGLATPAPYGGKQRQIMVDVDPLRAAAKGMSPQDVVNSVLESNVIIPAGVARLGNTEYDVQLNASPERISDFDKMPLRVINGAPVLLGDVAHVHDGYAVQTNIARVNGKRASYLSILKKADASTLTVVNAMKELLPQIKASAPEGVELKVDFDQSVFVRAAVNGVLREALIAAVLVSLMVLFFLGSWKSMVVVSTSIPLAAFCSVIGLFLTGQTLNLMTLGGLALAIGMLVDDATVEVENIHRNRLLGKPLTVAILDGAKQVAIPALAATLTICIVFFPVVMLEVPARFLFTPLAMSVVFAMLASYVLSRTLVPTLVRKLTRGEEKEQQEKGDAKKKAVAEDEQPKNGKAKDKGVPPEIQAQLQNLVAQEENLKAQEKNLQEQQRSLRAKSPVSERRGKVSAEDEKHAQSAEAVDAQAQNVAPVGYVSENTHPQHVHGDAHALAEGDARAVPTQIDAAREGHVQNGHESPGAPLNGHETEAEATKNGHAKSGTAGDGAHADGAEKKGHAKSGTSGDGAHADGAQKNGHAKNGTSEDGAHADGAQNNDHAKNGRARNGAPDDGHARQNGHARNGVSAKNGAAENGHAKHEKPHGVWGRFNAWRDRHFDSFRDFYVRGLTHVLEHRLLVLVSFLILFVIAGALVKVVGLDFFPTVDAGQMRIHFRAPIGTRLEETENLVGEAEDIIRGIVPEKDLETINSNIGIPTSYNLAFVQTDNIGSQDAEILVALKPGHKPTVGYERKIREELPKRFPGTVIYFQAADIVSQVLNFGLSAPIDVQVDGRDRAKTMEIARQLKHELEQIPGTVDARIAQVVNKPALHIEVDRQRAALLGLTERDVANNMLTSLSSSSTVSPSYWVSPENGVNYSVVVQTPIERLKTVNDLLSTPIGTGTPGSSAATSPYLGSISAIKPTETVASANHYTVQPIIEVQVGVDGRDLGAVAGDIDAVVKKLKLPQGVNVTVRGQSESMSSSFKSLGLGLVLAIALVYLLLVVLFQSYVDPFIIIVAVPGALIGVLWMLAVTGTTLNVESFMGAIMAVGIAVSNSILLVSFANEVRVDQNLEVVAAAIEAGRTRLRPVLMTALAMILGMLPTSLGLGEGGEQNAPLGRAVIGGLLVATFVTLFVVPLVYTALRKAPPTAHALDEEFEKESQGHAA